MANNFKGDFPSFDEYLENNRVSRLSRKRSRAPFYDDNADYNTNSKSYYDYLARNEKLINILAQRIWEYDEELAKRFEEWDKNLEEFPDDVKDLLIKWLEDGTLEEIINENIFKDLNDKIDKKFSLDGYYHEHKINYYRDEKSDTSYTIVKIPKYDEDGNLIKIKVTDDRDRGNDLNLKTTQLAKKKQATVMMNASANSGANNTNDRATILNNGEQRRDDSDMEEFNYLIGWDDENRMKSFPPNSRISDIKDDGYTTLIPAFMPLIEQGKDITDDTPLDSLSNATDPHPRSVLAQDYDGNTLFFTSNGRLMGEFGMNSKDVARVLLNHNVKWAHMLDGGGSTTLVNYHQIINRMSGAETGDRGATERPVRNAVYIGKEEVNKAGTEVLSTIGDNVDVFHRFNKYIESLRYEKSNYISLEQFFVNGWQPYESVGSNTPRAWVLPNNTLYLRGVVTEGVNSSEDNTTFMKLPPEIPPFFTTHHLVSGDVKGHVYKVVIQSDGECKWYFWDDRTQDTEVDREYPYYIRLDGIFVPLNYTSTDGYTRTQGIQKAWLPYPLSDDNTSGGNNDNNGSDDNGSDNSDGEDNEDRNITKVANLYNIKYHDNNNVNYPYDKDGNNPDYPFNRPHLGVDLNFVNEQLLSPVKGKAYYFNDPNTSSNGGTGYGNHIIIESDDGHEYLFGHLDRALISDGDDVEIGDRIAITDNTGDSTGPHLHFEVRKGSEASLSYGGKGETIDPAIWRERVRKDEI